MRVCVTGGSGMLGRAVAAQLQRAEHMVVWPMSRTALDCRDANAVYAWIATERPDAVVHLAATVGGIAFNAAHPATLLHDNLAMALAVCAASVSYPIRLIVVSSACAYPADAPVPTPEGALWDGRPEPSNAAYGIAKRVLVELVHAYRQEHGLDGVALIPTNLYGPGTHGDRNRWHVIPAMIDRFLRARRDGAPTATCWGTGTPTRDFLYVDDCARAIVAAATAPDAPEGPINLGSGRETSIREIAETVARLVGYEGAIEWDAHKPDGQRRRALDSRRAADWLGWRATTSLEDGLRATIAAWPTQ
ncbi:MAG: NAD-dependent epimerase/dehydratase family protein [bacterium]|nr:NAD-dependent epimerase/dehydratase family protein [bacterium]